MVRYLYGRAARSPDNLFGKSPSEKNVERKVNEIGSPVEDLKDVVNQENAEMGTESPIIGTEAPPIGSVNETNYGPLLADETADQDQEMIGGPEVEQAVEDAVQDSLPKGLKPRQRDIDDEAPPMKNAREAVEWAIQNRRVMQIQYKISAVRSRGGKRLKKDKMFGGREVNRVVEPHHIFQAKNGNELVVTWDRSVRAIRAYIINNILEYFFLRRKPFNLRKRLLPGSERGIKPMEPTKIETPEQGQMDTMQILQDTEAQLVQMGLQKTAYVVGDALKTYKSFKVAQYVGSQGYWIRNRRCWDNCYRQKRTSSPSTPAQEVWQGCWKEYLASINDDKSGWEKYAGTDKNAVEHKAKEWHLAFINKVENKIRKGLKRPEAIYATIEEQQNKYFEKLSTEASHLSEIAVALQEAGHKELGEKIAKASAEMLKESWLGDWVGKAWNWLFGGNSRKIINVLKEIADEASRIAQALQQQMKPQMPQQKQPQAASSSKKIVTAILDQYGNEIPSTQTTNPNAAQAGDQTGDQGSKTGVQTTTQAAKQGIPEYNSIQRLIQKINEQLTWISEKSQKDPKMQSLFTAAYTNLDQARDNVLRILQSGSPNIVSDLSAGMYAIAKGAQLAMQKMTQVIDNPQEVAKQPEAPQPEAPQAEAPQAEAPQAATSQATLDVNTVSQAIQSWDVPALTQLEVAIQKRIQALQKGTAK